jgi:hypothetical protein
MHLARNNEDQMAFVTPVVANVRGTIFNYPKLNLPKLARAHGGSSQMRPGVPMGALLTSLSCSKASQRAS